MENKIFKIATTILNVPADSLSLDSSPESIENWDSLSHMKLILAVEEELKIQFTDKQISSIKDIKSLIVYSKNLAGS